MRDRSKWTGGMGSLERAIDLCREAADEAVKKAESGRNVSPSEISRAITFYDFADRLQKENERRTLKEGTSNG